MATLAPSPSSINSPLRPSNVAQAALDPAAALSLLATAIEKDRADAIGQLISHQGPTLGSEPLPPGVPNAEPGDTALHYACRLGRVDSVRALLRAGVICSVRNSRNQLAFEAAQSSDKRTQIEHAFVAELLQHVCSGNAPRVERLLKGGVKADSPDGSPNQATLLHWAATFGQGREIVRLLCEAGANVNAQNKVGLTPAHEAAGHGRFVLAFVFPKTKHTHMAFVFVVFNEKNSLETLESLVEFGANLSLKDNQGRTPRDLAKGAVELYFAEDHLTTPSKPPPRVTTPSLPSKREATDSVMKKEDDAARLRRQLEEQVCPFPFF